VRNIELGFTKLVLLDGDLIVEQQAIGEAIAARSLERRFGQPGAIEFFPIHSHIHVGISVGQPARRRAAQRDHAHLWLAGIPAGDLAGELDPPLARVVHWFAPESTKDEGRKTKDKGRTSIRHSSSVFRQISWN